MQQQTCLLFCTRTTFPAAKFFLVRQVAKAGPIRLSVGVEMENLIAIFAQTDAISSRVGPLLITLVIGAIAGFLAGQIMKGRGFGLVGNIIVGVVGAMIFGYLFGSLNLIGNAFVDPILGGTIGSVILLFLISLIKKAT